MATKKMIKDETLEQEINPTDTALTTDKDVLMMQILMKLSDKLDKIENNANPTVNSNVEKMNRLCTIIHLQECLDGLETTISVNNNIQYFRNFGETKLYRYSDMQQIVTRYRQYFDRGIFALGEDCQDLAVDFGINIIKGIGDSKYFNSLIDLNDVDFEKEYIKMNDIKKRNYIKLFVMNLYKQNSKYKNELKIAIINKHSNNILQNIEG